MLRLVRQLAQISFRDGKNRDLLLFALLMSLAFAGQLILYPASSVVSSRDFGDSMYFIKRQSAWFVVGLAGLFVATAYPLERLRRQSLGLLLAVMVGLLLVFIPGIGHSVSSSKESFHRWIGLGPFTFQPSEFAKPALILFLSAFLTKGGILHIDYDLKKSGLPILLIALSLAAIVLEPQYGTTICILVSLVTIIFIAGFPMIRLLLGFAAALPVLFLFAILWEYRLSRFRVWLDPYAYRLEGGYQLVTSFRAFEGGGFLGRELASGFAHRYLTYGHTDFILALFAEDWGWLGVLLLILLYLAILWRGVLTLRMVEEPFPFLLGAGSLVMLYSQAILNMAVVTGLLPTTGVSLPFVSYGGSSLVVSFLFGGFLINASAYARPQETQDGSRPPFLRNERSLLRNGSLR